MVFGTENKQDSTKQSNISKEVSDNGYYADYQFSPLDSLFLTMGGRLDDHETFGTHKTGHGTAAYLVDATATRLHGSYGTGFRAPSLYELFHPTYGTQALKPEESRGWDAGVEQQILNSRAGIDVTWFDNRIQNLIQWQNNKYINVASTRARGAEFGGHFDVTQALRLNASYTFTDSRNNTTGQMLARRPKHQASFGAAGEPLGRHLIGEAAGLAVAKDNERSEMLVNLNLWHEDRRGKVLVRLTASAVADEVLLSMDSLRNGAMGFAIDADIRTLLDFADAWSGARHGRTDGSHEPGQGPGVHEGGCRGRRGGGRPGAGAQGAARVSRAEGYVRRRLSRRQDGRRRRCCGR